MTNFSLIFNPRFLQDGGLVHIANGLVDQSNSDSGGLASIVLWNLGLTHEGMYGFCNALVSCF